MLKNDFGAGVYEGLEVGERVYEEMEDGQEFIKD